MKRFSNFLVPIKEREDVISKMIKEMNVLSEKQDFEGASDILKQIKEELDREEKEHIFLETDLQTVKDVDSLLKKNYIRLNPKNFDFANYLNLITKLHDRKDELMGGKAHDIERQRRIVAEEMVCAGMTIPKKKRGMGRAPNRAFLNIALKVDPSLCKTEIQRREQVKLWKAIGSCDIEGIEACKKKIREIQKFGKGE